jgi:hypothetical protein
MSIAPAIARVQTAPKSRACVDAEPAVRLPRNGPDAASGSCGGSVVDDPAATLLKRFFTTLASWPERYTASLC